MGTSTLTQEAVETTQEYLGYTLHMKELREDRWFGCVMKGLVYIQTLPTAKTLPELTLSGQRAIELYKQEVQRGKIANSTVTSNSGGQRTDDSEQSDPTGSRSNDNSFSNSERTVDDIAFGGHSSGTCAGEEGNGTCPKDGEEPWISGS